MTLREAIAQADLTPEILVKSFKNIVKIIEIEEKPAMTFQVTYEGDKYSASLDLSMVKLSSYHVVEHVWEKMRETNFTSEFLMDVVEKLVSYLEENDVPMYKIPIPLGLKPIKLGCVPSLDLRVYETEEK